VLGVAALCLFALGCRHKQKVARQQSSEALASKHPEIIIEDFQTQVHRDGIKLQEIKAAWGLMDQIDQTIDMRALRVKFYDNGLFKGEAVSGTGRTWLKDRPEEQAQAHDLIMDKTATMLTNDGILLRSPRMEYRSTSDTLTSDAGFIKQIPNQGGRFIIECGDRFEIKMNSQRNNFDTYKEYGRPVVLHKSQKPELTP